MTSDFNLTLAIVGAVIVASTLLSGVAQKIAFPQVAVFLGLGLLVGPHGLGLVDVHMDSPLLMAAGTLCLTLVLFTGAVSLDLREIREHARLVFRVVGPGTLLAAAVIAGAGWWLLELAPAHAAILGAALASTDPVLLRGLLHRKDIPADARLALQMESGLNDAVLVPIILVAISVIGGGHTVGWGALAVEILLFGPLVGVAVGVAGLGLLQVIRKRPGVRRDYESLYSLGIAFAAYAAGEAVHGSGFLAAFAAGLTIVALDVELCDCFVEYGETTAELALLFAFVLFGVGPIWTAFQHLDLSTLLFAAIAVLARLVIVYAALAGAGMRRQSRWLVSWFGPRGLSSLLLVLLPAFAGVPGTARLLGICSLVVLVSVVLHGGSLMLLRRRVGPEPAAGFVAESTVEPESGAPAHAGVVMTLAELQRLQAAGPVVIADVRTAHSARDDAGQVKGALRLDPEHAVEDARRLGLKPGIPIALYCA